MRASPYNNPLFAQGLAGLVEGFIGNPAQTAQAELMAAQAKNENMTAQFRNAMDVGLGANGTNLSDMMVRALQAGNQYSGNAPKVSAAIRQDQAGILGMPRARGGGGGSSSGGGSGAVKASMFDAIRQGANALAAAKTDDEDEQARLSGALLADALANPSGASMDALSDAFSRIQTTAATPDTAWFSDNSTPETYAITPLSDLIANATAGTQASEGVGQPAGRQESAAGVAYLSDEELVNFPSGTRFIARDDPTGTIRIKP